MIPAITGSKTRPQLRQSRTKPCPLCRRRPTRLRPRDQTLRCLLTSHKRAMAANPGIPQLPLQSRPIPSLATLCYLLFTRQDRSCCSKNSRRTSPIYSRCQQLRPSNDVSLPPPPFQVASQAALDKLLVPSFHNLCLSGTQTKRLWSSCATTQICTAQ